MQGLRTCLDDAAWVLSIDVSSDLACAKLFRQVLSLQIPTEAVGAAHPEPILLRRAWAEFWPQLRRTACDLGLVPLLIKMVQYENVESALMGSYTLMNLSRSDTVSDSV